MLLRIVLGLLALWLVVTVLGFLFKAVFWLAIVGIVLFLITAAVGALRRDRLHR